MARRQAEKLNTRQAKVAAVRAEEARKMRRLLLALTAVGAVIVVVVALVVVKLATGGSSTPSARHSGSEAAASRVVSTVGSIPQSVFDKIGPGSIQSPPQRISPPGSLTADGRPRVLYVGAEYCPYCAAERWAIVTALSRFGTFQNIGLTASSAQDVYPSTATLTFHGATYSSKYLAFNGYETEANRPQGSGYAPLDKLPASDQAIFQKYDAPPYVASQSAGSIPFVIFGGKWMISGASYDPGQLKGMTHEQIANALSNPNSAVAKSVDGTANMVSAALCRLTNNQPVDVCTSKGVTTAAKALARPVWSYPHT
jgi:hypothetical protein